jgi:hypothetical protein
MNALPQEVVEFSTLQEEAKAFRQRLQRADAKYNDAPVKQDDGDQRHPRRAAG